MVPGLASTVACFPLETIRTRLAVEPGAYTGIWNCLCVLTPHQGPLCAVQGALLSPPPPPPPLRAYPAAHGGASHMACRQTRLRQSVLTHVSRKDTGFSAAVRASQCIRCAVPSCLLVCGPPGLPPGGCGLCNRLTGVGGGTS